MTLTSLVNRSCTIVKRTADGTTDTYGNDVPVEQLVETVCELQEQQRTEPAADGELGISTWLVIFNAGEDFGQGDAVIVDQQVYEAIGPPWEARNPRTQAASHIEATCRRVAGVGVGS